MDKISINNHVIDEIISYLKLGYFIEYLDGYFGDILEGEKSPNRFKISRENIYLVNDIIINTTTGKTLKLQKLVYHFRFNNELVFIPYWLAIDSADWKIYLKLGEPEYEKKSI